MTNHLHGILAQWYTRRDLHRWVLGTVINIEGSNYRKTGAMILVNELGRYFGLISGGCLEKSLLLDVKKVLTFNQPLQVFFDSSDNSDSPWAMALGCGGKVTILLQPIHTENRYHHLDQLYLALVNRTAAYYAISLNANQLLNRLIKPVDVTAPFNLTEPFDLPAPFNSPVHSTHYFSDQAGDSFLAVAVRPQIHLMIFGGGIDAIPLVQMASVLGWQITLIDNRVGYAKSTDFPAAHTIIRESADAFSLQDLFHKIDAAIVMTHNIGMDALAISSLQNSTACYIGLLGPEHRKYKVLHRAGIGDSAIHGVIHGPMGISIGGDLPESVALATLAECHQVLESNQFSPGAKNVAPRHRQGHVA
jgi:xanthine dehydrogenase accessory factor